MFSFPTRSKNSRDESFARADYIIQSVRAHLPPSSLWHEKRFDRAQMESLVVVSTGGLYDVKTFDRTEAEFHESLGMFHFSDLGFSVQHVPGSRNTLTMAQMERLVRDANDEFNQLVASDRVTAISMIRRVTVTIDYCLPVAQHDDFARTCFSNIAHRLGLQLTYVPYITRDCWLPDSDFYNASACSEESRSAAEFVLSSPEYVDTVDAMIKSSFDGYGTGTIRAPGIHATMPGGEQPYDIHFVGRSY